MSNSNKFIAHSLEKIKISVTFHDETQVPLMSSDNIVGAFIVPFSPMTYVSLKKSLPSPTWILDFLDRSNVSGNAYVIRFPWGEVEWDFTDASYEIPTGHAWYDCTRYELARTYMHIWCMTHIKHLDAYQCGYPPILFP